MAEKRSAAPSDAVLRAYLSELVNTTLPGTRLPGLRTMMQQSGAGRIRLEHLLDEMAAAHRVEIRPRSGIYRMDVLKSDILFIHFSSLPVVEEESDFIGGTLKMLRSCAAAENSVISALNAADMPTEELTVLLKNYRCRRAFIWGARELSETLQIAREVPFCVDILPRHPSAFIAEVRDSNQMTDIQMQYLLQRNYRRIAFIHNAENDWSRTPVQLSRLMEYYRIMAENGLKVEPEWVFYCGYNCEYFNSCMHKMMNSHRPPEAVIVPGGWTLLNLYNFCSSSGIAIGQELAVISCDDTAGELVPNPTRVTNTPAEIGRQAWRIMQHTVAGTPLQEHTFLRIITGETVPFKQ